MEKIKDRRFVVAVALATVLVLVLVLWRGASAELAYPFDRARSVFARSVASRVAGLFRSAATAAENVRLRREVASLALVGEDARRLAAENDRLRSALAFSARTPGRWIAAEVLSEAGGAAGVRRIVRLDKGARAGIVRGAAVVATEGLVGRVTAVTPHTAEVTLLGDPSLRVSCEVETGAGRAAPRGILQGGDGGTLPLKYLTRAGALVPARQRVVTSGLGEVFPRGIPVGFLVARSAEEGSVLPAVDFEDLEFLFVRREE